MTAIQTTLKRIYQDYTGSHWTTLLYSGMLGIQWIAVDHSVLQTLLYHIGSQWITLDYSPMQKAILDSGGLQWIAVDYSKRSDI